MNCARCSNEKMVFLPYLNENLCTEHFEQYFEHRVRNTIRVNKFFEEGEKIAVAVSGGKDSIVTLNLLKKIMPRNEIVGISIDEGIDGYRNKAIDEAVKNYKALDIEYKIVKLKEEIGNSMQEIVQKTHENNWKENSCTFCGVFRRKYINAAALELGADKLATGHNLDDEVQSICMNFFMNRTEKLARLGPKIESKNVKGWVPRVKPLYNTPEDEVELFAQVKNYPHYNESCCPFSHGADRNIYRLMVDQMELKKVGTKFSIVKAFMKMKPYLEQMDKETVGGHTLQMCKECGDLTSQPLCQACVYEKRIKETGKLEKVLSPREINNMGKKPTTRVLPVLNNEH